VPVGAGGDITVYNLTGSANLIVDVGGWFTDYSNPSATGARYVAMSPSRICDTRDASQPGVDPNECNYDWAATGTLGQEESRPLAVEGQGACRPAGLLPWWRMSP
jgi:hypothetical protein